jgi:hypothetical protein
MSPVIKAASLPSMHLEAVTSGYKFSFPFLRSYPTRIDGSMLTTMQLFRYKIAPFGLFDRKFHLRLIFAIKLAILGLKQWFGF